MNAMGYPQPYPGQAPSYTQVTRRMMTDVERQFPIGVYKGIQKAVRGLSVVCLVLFIVYILVINSLYSDPETFDTIAIVMGVLTGVFGLVSIGASINTLLVRKRVSNAMMEGTVVEVVGPAYRTAGPKNAMSLTVGPVSMMATREVLGLIQEGAPTSVLCIPKLKAAIAVNNVGLRNGARVMLPPNIEMMATQVSGPAPPVGNSWPYQSQTAMAPGQVMPQAPASTEELPPPPTD